MSPLNLLFVVEDAGDDNVLQSLGWIEAEPLGDGLYSLRTKVSLRVHVHNLFTKKGGGRRVLGPALQHVVQRATFEVGWGYVPTNSR